MKDIIFYKKTTDDFYPNYDGDFVQIFYGRLSNNWFCINVSGTDDYVMCKISPNSLNKDLFYLLELDYITKDLLQQRGFS